MDLSEFLLDIAPNQETPVKGVASLDFAGLLRTPLKIEQDGGAHGCGGKLWPAGDLLGRYLIRKVQDPSFGAKYKCALELGSGTGLSGLAVALANPSMRCYITDQKQMVPLMEANILINQLEDRVFAQELNWGEQLPEYCKDVDLILAADCVYLESAFPLLEATLLQLTESKPVPILMAYKKRRKADKRFFTSIKKHFVVTEIKEFPEYEAFVRDSVHLFSLSRR